VDLVFAPSAGQMYPRGSSTFVKVEGILTQVLCGAKRPGHFQGVTTIVCKLFNLVRPHRAYFGQKDAQQLRVIQQMVSDLNFDVEIVPMPIIREPDGLALSSRNKNLSLEERQAALVISKSLNFASDLIKAGERNASKLKAKIVEFISKEPLSKIDYVSMVNANTLEEVSEISGEVLIALAVFIGNTRLIDNIRIVDS
jgi:pantoate--beta-alanine ligase